MVFSNPTLSAKCLFPAVPKDARIGAAKPGPTAYKLADAHPLHLYVSPQGSKLWRMKFRFGGNEKTLSLGSYPLVSLVAAREKRDDARRLLPQGLASHEGGRAHARSFGLLGKLGANNRRPTVTAGG